MVEAARIPSARERGRQVRLDRILDSASRLFAGQGFAKTSVDEIAATAGVSKGLVYDHYDSKEELFSAVFWREMERWDGETVSHAVFDEDDVPRSLANVLRASIHAVRRNPFLRRVLTQDMATLLPLERENAIAFVVQYCQKLEAVLAHGVRTGQLRSDLDTGSTAQVIWAIHHALAPGILVTPDGEWRPDADAVLQSAIDLVIHGIRS
jgi:AcrR family transcriptional regulator